MCEKRKSQLGLSGSSGTAAAAEVAKVHSSGDTQGHFLLHLVTVPPPHLDGVSTNASFTCCDVLFVPPEPRLVVPLSYLAHVNGAEISTV